MTASINTNRKLIKYHAFKDRKYYFEISQINRRLAFKKIYSIWNEAIPA